MTDGRDRARELLQELEDVLAAKDLDAIADLFGEDVVLIGDDSEHFDRRSTVEYLGLMADMAPTVRWSWDQVVVVLDAPETLSFAAAGAIWFEDASGHRLDEPEPFRVTCLASDDGDRWRWRHFHGSRPAAE